MASDDVSARLNQIQAQLASLQESYGDIARTYYNIFYNPEPMDVTLTLYDDEGELKEITVPNRSKDAKDNIYTSTGNPNGSIVAPLGALCFDNVNYKLYFKTIINGSSSEGWVELLSADNFIPNVDYIPYTNGNGNYLTRLSASSISSGVLPIERGGTGSQTLEGVLKGVPTKYDEAGNIEVPGYITTAQPGVDYTSLSSFTGLIAFAPITFSLEGFLICDGGAYRVDHYYDLYELLTRRYAATGEVYHVKFPYGDGDEEGTSFTDESKSYFVREYDEVYDEADVEYFRVPNLMGYVPRFWSPDPANTVDTEPDRKVLSFQEDMVPNIKGQWAQEITGLALTGEGKAFDGAVAVKLDEEGRPYQVDGKTSAPGGYYDYLIDFNASRCSDLYNDDAKEIRVKNVALLPIIKYSISS